LGVEGEISFKRISKYELDQNEPPLSVLLQYARVAGVHMEDLVDDDLDLPTNLPGPVRYKGIKRASAARSKKRQK
jgi:transcriptional regulator with XRE-family HTH domain